MEAGDFPAARMTDAEALAVNEAATGRNEIISPAFARATFTGTEAEFYGLVDRSHEIAASLTGRAPGIIQWAVAVFEIGLGRYEEALAAARKARAGPIDTGAAVWVLPELVEAAIRCAATDTAHEALKILADVARDGHRLLSRRDGMVPRTYQGEGSRARLPRSARPIRFADRARRELLATGATVRRRSPETLDDLTAREAQIARLAADGLSNPEIGTRLFVSPRTAEYHLAKVPPS